MVPNSFAARPQTSHTNVQDCVPMGRLDGLPMTPLPTEQHQYDGLPELSVAQLHNRRETIFFVIAGLFLGTLAMLNILGITRFLDLSFVVPKLGWRVPMKLAVGVLPYPVTFLCTDFISELYGRRRANVVVLVGFMLNVWVVLFLWLGAVLPGVPSPVYEKLRHLANSAVTASMIAYLVAQLVDVQLFHFWKRLTDGRHLWLRNNASTLISGLIDNTVFSVLAWVVFAPEPIGWQPLIFTFILGTYVLRMVVAVLDTPFVYLARWIARPPAAGAYA